MLRKLTITLITASLSICAGCATNPITGKTQLMLISEEQDFEIGQKYAPEIEKQMGGQIQNAAIQNYVNSVGQKIAAVSHKPEWTFEFVALNDDTVNAFALPGGRLFITKGMLKSLTTEAQLASILAHETVHTVARHSSEAMSRQIGIQMLLSTVTTEETSKGLLTVADLTNQIIGMKFSRDDEREADSGGLDYMVRAGYNPYGMVETMQMLESQSGSRQIEFLSTHPSPKNRAQDLTNQIQKKYPNATALKTAKQQYQISVLNNLTN